jgi:hypothetical protein
MLRSRSLPPSGYREQVGDIAVTAHCGPGCCIELHELSATFERAVRVATVTSHYVSVYQGFTQYSGGAHANNSLACATWARGTGRQVRLSEILPLTEVKTLRERATIALQDFRDETGRPPYTLDEESFLYDEEARRVVFCALAPFVVAGTIVEVPLNR